MELPKFFLFSILLFAGASAGLYFLYKRRADILEEATRKAEAITGNADKSREEIVAAAKARHTELVDEATQKVEAIESRVERLKNAESDLQSRLKEVRARLETMTDIAGEQAASIELIRDSDLLSSQEYQKDRKQIRTRLKKAAQDAVKNVRGYKADVNIGQYVGVSAKSDMAGALLMITTEMLCAKTTANNGHASLDKLHDSIRATGALLKAVDARAELDREFTELLDKRLKIEIDYQRARQLAREKQKEIREQEREERRARKEAEQAQKQAEIEEEIKRNAIAELEQRLALESEEERAKHREELERLQQELAEAHERSERARSRAQDTRQGHVYVISNIGSFGEGVLKIGMTRRLDPLDRVKELGDASVPFSFDIHALIESDDAPSLESDLHRVLNDRRVNKVNLRKEYFRVSIEEIEQRLADSGIEALVNSVPSADEYYETLKIEKSLIEN
ncbi:GIY-YIG nuclease family protein [Parahaliea aestuarii]|uniref:Bacteriophage T5 Orf172 DNA-binding domain-containing protein n=1 Tax=Parahaliea aestuarii TaxID=1852021 RepID=A0A5C8ZK39_9GAMM|nr:GIY-YIG nuclease family protein [Parahaliea aestuarii]TXS88976.1 hypothetical protein FVW59_19280 [Parahaliea aestuarii]